MNSIFLKKYCKDSHDEAVVVRDFLQLKKEFDIKTTPNFLIFTTPKIIIEKYNLGQFKITCSATKVYIKNLYLNDYIFKIKSLHKLNKFHPHAHYGLRDNLKNGYLCVNRLAREWYSQRKLINFIDCLLSGLNNIDKYDNYYGFDIDRVLKYCNRSKSIIKCTECEELIKRNKTFRCTVCI